MCIERGSLTSTEAVKIVQDILFNTANQLYGLKLPLVPLNSNVLSDMSLSKASWTNNVAQLRCFLDQEPAVQFLRLQWLDYTNTLRLRVLPIKQALRMFREDRFIGIVEAVFGLLQTDFMSSGSATGTYIPEVENLFFTEIGSQTMVWKRIELFYSHDLLCNLLVFIKDATLTPKCE